MYDALPSFFWKIYFILKILLWLFLFRTEIDVKERFSEAGKQNSGKLF